MDLKNIIVANKIDTERIVINKGEEDGIEEYMEFLVYSEGEEIFDPTTEKSLGYLENPKAKFKTLHIQKKMTTLISKTKVPNTIAMLRISLSDITNPELKLLESVREGDKVKIINQL